jgi:hypothetical protein
MRGAAAHYARPRWEAFFKKYGAENTIIQRAGNDGGKETRRVPPPPQHTHRHRARRFSRITHPDPRRVEEEEGKDVGIIAVAIEHPAIERFYLLD